MVDAIPGASHEIVRSILVARNLNVLLDSDLAALYRVSTTALNQAVKRNAARFPQDFAFRLTSKETNELNKLRGTLDAQKHRDPLKPPFAFSMSVYVVRAFASLREAARANADLVKQLQLLEKRVGKHDAEIDAILTAMRALVIPAPRLARGIGFLADIK